MAYVPKTWIDGEIAHASEMNHIEQGIAAADQAATAAQETADEAKAIVAGEFLTTKTYTTGEYCIYSGALYRFTADKTAGAWDSTKVVAVAIADDVSELKSILNAELNPVNLTGWELGSFLSNGTDYASNKRIRNKTKVGMSEGTELIKCDDGYKFLVLAYNAGGTCLGILKTSGSFTTVDSGDVQWLQEFPCYKYPTYEFKVALSTEPDSTSITSADGVHCYFYMATDKTLSIENKAADAKVTGDAIADISEKIANIIHTSQNVFDKSSAIRNAYASPNGVQTSSSYANWFASELIPVNGATKLQSNIALNSVIIYNADNTIDTTNSYNGLNSPATLPFTLPNTANKIRVSAKMTLINSDIMLNFGDELLPYTEYGETRIDDELLAVSLKENPVLPKLNSLITAEDYLASCKQALKKDVLLSYFATFTGFTSLKIGFTTSNNYATGYLDYIEITGTNFILHRKNQNDITWAHGLTLKDYVSVHITFDFSMKFSAVVKTNGGEFTKTNYFYLGASYYPFAIIDATGAANNNLSFSCSDFQKNVLLFGDSYFGNSSARWLYYLTDDQRKNLCINGYAGESSPSAIIDCESLFGLCTPKFAVWCIGMNDGSDVDDTTPSTQWLTNVQKFINFCDAKNIQPILATIPSVPTINNRAKSAWVRASGFRYIDFAYAVNTGSNGEWYENMLSADGVHPDVAGAKALCARAITDFPEMLID